jgi:hypothetical protein
MPHHLGPVQDDDAFDDELAETSSWDDAYGERIEDEPLVRPSWWRWVAVIVILAMVVAGPIAYAVYRLLA